MMRLQEIVTMAIMNIQYCLEWSSVIREQSSLAPKDQK